jgi:hypothetical protein
MMPAAVPHRYTVDPHHGDELGVFGWAECWRASCEPCGWVGPPRKAPAQASEDGGLHVANRGRITRRGAAV